MLASLFPRHLVAHVWDDDTQHTRVLVDKRHDLFAVSLFGGQSELGYHSSGLSEARAIQPHLVALSSGQSLGFLSVGLGLLLLLFLHLGDLLLGQVSWNLFLWHFILPSWSVLSGLFHSLVSVSKTSHGMVMILKARSRDPLLVVEGEEGLDRLFHDLSQSLGFHILTILAPEPSERRQSELKDSSVPVPLAGYLPLALGISDRPEFELLDLRVV